MELLLFLSLLLGMTIHLPAISVFPTATQPSKAL